MARIIVPDSNVVIDFFNGRLGSSAMNRLEGLFSERLFAISIITRLEILAGLHKEANPDLFIRFLQEAVTIELLPLLEISIVHIRRETGIKLPDAIIAATALFLDATFVTSDQGGFNRVIGLDIWTPERRPLGF